MAAQTSGRWTVYPVIGDTFSNIIETADKVYMLSNGRLSHYSLDDNESYSYNTLNKLSDASAISEIYYNYDKKYLLLTYSNGNIDLIYDNGRVVNIPDIKDAILTTGHDINHISFGDNRIYAATKFGIVVIDEQKYHVIESGVFNVNIDFIFPMGEYLTLIQGTNLYAMPITDRHNQLDKFTLIGQLSQNGEVYKLSDTRLVFSTYIKYTQYYSCVIDFKSKTITTKGENSARTFPGKPVEGGVFLQDVTNYTFIDSEGNRTQKAIPETLKGQVAFSKDGTLTSLWISSHDGYSRYDMSGTTPTQLMAPSRPEGFSVYEPAIMKYNSDGTRLYVANVAPSWVIGTPGNNYDKPSYLDIVENDIIHDASVLNPSRYTNEFNNYDTNRNMNNWRLDPTTGRIGGCNRFIEDPDDPSIYYLASDCAGIIVVKDRNVINVLNKSNTDIAKSKWMNRSVDVNIDRHGNLWMCSGYEEGDVTYSILPADKRRDITNVTSSDWYKPVRVFNQGSPTSRDAISLICKKSNYIILYGGNNYAGSGIAVYDDNNTSGNISDDKCVHHLEFTDTEGTLKHYYHINNFVEDQNGDVWVVSNLGPFIMKPSEAFSPDFRIKRPIVPRNDGTNFGDYLLETEEVFCISVDPSNRKWLGTASSGVYLVNADGTEILAHYTTDNSVLPSNTVWSVACDPHSNKVYFGTDSGIVSYESDSAPAADDYSDVYAYPNPVRPDYTGWITVTGLMDNSLVKIADISGNIVFQGQSEGGMILWDGCNPDGQRVRSGVYLVFASQNGSGRSSGAVTKIMVIN